MSSRDELAEALLARVTELCGASFATYSRKFEMYTDLVQKLSDPNPAQPVPAFPALYIYEGVGFGNGGHTQWERSGTALAKRTLNWTIVFYALKPQANTPEGADNTNAGAISLNPLIESVEAAFAPDDLSLNVLTLGGKCRHCWIEGDGETIPGDIDPTGLMMQTIPVKLLMP